MEYTNAKGKGTGKYNGMAKASDWIGQEIVVLEDIMNIGGKKVKKGTTGLVKSANKGLTITFNQCEHCGTVAHISGISYSQVELK